MQIEMRKLIRNPKKSITSMYTLHKPESVIENSWIWFLRVDEMQTKR